MKVGVDLTGTVTTSHYKQISDYPKITSNDRYNEIHSTDVESLHGIPVCFFTVIEGLYTFQASFWCIHREKLESDKQTSRKGAQIL